jgi:fumarylacetoacetase
MSWVEEADRSRFAASNLPFGIFVPERGQPPRVGVRIGDHVLDVGGAARQLDHDDAALLGTATLNLLMSAGPSVWTRVRDAVADWVTDRRYEKVCRRLLHGIDGVELLLPFEVADYVDFLSSEQHAQNGGRIFRPSAPALPVNWHHMPIGYHGRAGSLVVTGTPVIRPWGLARRADDARPTYGPSAELDFEAEVGFVVGVGSDRPVATSQWRDHVFGVFLLNDWSARDIQAFESAPLGPFLGKSFQTSISPWVVSLAALEGAFVANPPRREPLADHLHDTGQKWGLDLTLEVSLNGHVIARPPFSTMYWNAAQQLAHLTGNGGSLRCGDVFASGTVSGPTRGEWGSLLELSWRGQTPVELPDGTTRSFLQDGDVVSITASAPGPAGARIGFGDVAGVVRAS